MVSFANIYKEYDSTKNVCDFCEKYKTEQVATRFLLIRSLDKKNLSEVLKKVAFNSTPEDKIENLTYQVYESSATVKLLLEHIESQRAELIKTRKNELLGLADIIREFPNVKCGIRNDSIDDIIKRLVRNKNVKSIDELTGNIDTAISERVRPYIFWSYYNQTAGDLIEMYFLEHQIIIPTIRKIRDIDFFVKNGEDIIPFDLKFTHISDEYFDDFSKGLKLTHTKPDSYVSENNEPELKEIKKFYKESKKKLNLPNLDGLKKLEIITKLTDTKECDEFISQMIDKRSKLVAKTASDLHPLEWWNYKNQGERLFCNNNRLFVFLAYKNKFDDGRPLSGKIDNIEKLIKNKLNNFTTSDIHEVKYQYKKATALRGDYKANAFSMIYTE
jgi:hypothetical protein